MKHLLAVTLFFAGCSSPLVPSAPPPIPERELYELGAWVSFETATHDAGGGGDNKPKLRVGDMCPDCAGTGRTGDGVIENPCSRCRATGKIQPDDPDLAGRTTAEMWAALERYP